MMHMQWARSKQPRIHQRTHCVFNIQLHLPQTSTDPPAGPRHDQRLIRPAPKNNNWPASGPMAWSTFNCTRPQTCTDPPAAPRHFHNLTAPAPNNRGPTGLSTFNRARPQTITDPPADPQHVQHFTAHAPSNRGSTNGPTAFSIFNRTRPKQQRIHRRTHGV